MPDRADLPTVLNTRIARFLAAIAVVLAAVVVVPTLTSRPDKDEEALKTAAEKQSRVEQDPSAAADAPIDITDDGAQPTGDEIPTDDGVTPTTRAGASKSTGSKGSGTTVASSPGSTVGSTGATVTTVAAVASTSTTAKSSTDCTEVPSAANEIASDFDAYRGGLKAVDGSPVGSMIRTAAMNDVAQAWACEMARNQAMAHNPNHDAQIKGACGSCTGTAENVAYDNSASHAWSAWINEPLGVQNHRANIEHPAGGVYGVGVARGANGVLYFVQDFGH